jgi:hypothetical protein
MKPTTKGNVCLAWGKGPATDHGEVVGFCGRCWPRLILGGETEEVIDPRTGEAWPVAELISSPRSKAASI